MRLAFPMRFQAEGGKYWVQGIGSLSGVLTEGESLDHARAMAREALSLMLASWLDDGKPIPRPDLVEGEGIEWIEPDPAVSAPILLRWAREDAGLTQADLARRLNVTRQAVQRLERSDANPSIKTLARAMRALGRELHLAV